MADGVPGDVVKFVKKRVSQEHQAVVIGDLRPVHPEDNGKLVLHSVVAEELVAPVYDPLYH